MNKLLVLGILLLFSLLEVNGQWYLKDYGVESIEMLTDHQLTESLDKTNQNLLISGAFLATGSFMVLYVSKTHPGVSEDAGIIAQLIGDRGMDMILIATGAGFAIGGTIALITYLSRRINIKYTLKSRGLYNASLDFSPIFIPASNDMISFPGVKFTITF